jgi:hypothetical protein
MRKFFVMLLFLVVISTLSGGMIAPIETETLDGDAFIFPTEAVKGSVAIVGLAMGTSRENGEVQQAQLIEWHTRLGAAPEPLNGAKLYHIPVIDAPRFIQGIIRRGIIKSYEEVIPLDQVAILFIKKPEQFASDAGIPIDDDATVAVISQDGTVAGYVKGSPTVRTITELQAIYQRELL